jgi:hypothetical protein
MHERPTSSPAAGAPPDLRVQILATEHWSLLATRSLVYNEVFSRAGIYLTVLSASVVSLALVAQATDFGDGFYVFALLVLPVVLVLGYGTYVRINDANAENVWLVLGMNRLRHAYVELAPEVEPYFIASHHDDEQGVMQSFGPYARVRMTQVLASTPVLVGLINAVVGGVLAGLLAEFVGAPTAVSIALGMACTALAITGLALAASRGLAQLRRRLVSRFPSGATDDAQ